MVPPFGGGAIAESAAIFGTTTSPTWTRAVQAPAVSAWTKASPAPAAAAASDVSAPLDEHAISSSATAAFMTHSLDAAQAGGQAVDRRLAFAPRCGDAIPPAPAGRRAPRLRRHDVAGPAGDPLEAVPAAGF